MGFKCLHYSVSEAIGTLSVQVIKKQKGQDLIIGVRTRNGTAVAGEDFTAIDEEIEFDEDDTIKSVSIAIVNDDVYEDNEEFYVELYDVDSGKKLRGTDTECKITVIDDDKPGIIGFERRTILVHPTDGFAKVKVHRLNGCDGQVSVEFETAIPDGLDAVAVPYKDFEPVRGTITFETGETEKDLFIKILNNDDKTEKDDVF